MALLIGFNAIFATSSIEAAKRYYSEFKRQQAESFREKLKVAIIYSFAPNEEEPDGILAEESFEPEGLDMASRDFLDSAIKDYNQMFGTSYDTSADKFQNYYKDLSLRIKTVSRLTIVVNMFLLVDATLSIHSGWIRICANMGLSRPSLAPTVSLIRLRHLAILSASEIWKKRQMRL